MRNKKLIFWILLGLAGLSVLLFLLLKDGNRTTNVFLNQPSQKPPSESTRTATIENQPESLAALLEQISSERMYSTLDDLTSIQPHSGWRGSATAGEKEALNYLQDRLDKLTWLADQGMTQEREEFHVFLGTEDHTSSVYFSIDGQYVEIPADAIRGNRDDPTLASQFDSDGQLGDMESDKISLENSVTLVPDTNVLNDLKGTNQADRIFILNFSIVESENALAPSYIKQIFDLDPAAIILVTQFSNSQGVSHGSFVGDKGGMLQTINWGKAIPILFIEMENLLPLGISGWDDMAALTLARIEWDTDVANPATSGNLIVHIPGEDAENPILLSAHVDSPNSPGALDDGSGTAILLEIATLLNENQIRPRNDLYLAWFGSEELAIYGSTYFTTTHVDLLHKLQANIQIDCLARPLDGLPAELTLMFSHLTTDAIASDPFASYLLEIGESLEIPLETTFWPFPSDNGSLSAFNIPNVNLIYESPEMNNYPGGVWVAGHFHDPYDRVELVREMENELLDLTKFVLTAAFAPIGPQGFVDHKADKSVIFIASHTESTQMTPTGLSNFSLALIRAGYRIGIIPYNVPVTVDGITGADLVVILPVHDYPAAENVKAYDTGWSPDEVEVIDEYVRNGGKVLVVNSANRLKFYNSVFDENEDWLDLNVLTSGWGVNFTANGSSSSMLDTNQHGFLSNISMIKLTPANAVAFTINQGDVLVGNSGHAYAAILEIGQGEVLVLSDLTMLGDFENSVLNPQLASNIANWK